MGDGRAEERDLHGAVKIEIGQIFAVAGKEARILVAQQPGADAPRAEPGSVITRIGISLSSGLRGKRQIRLCHFEPSLLSYRNIFTTVYYLSSHQLPKALVSGFTPGVSFRLRKAFSTRSGLTRRRRGP